MEQEICLRGLAKEVGDLEEKLETLSFFQKGCTEGLCEEWNNNRDGKREYETDLVKKELLSEIAHIESDIRELKAAMSSPRIVI